MCGVNAAVYPAEFLGVIGKSGAGKSTLLNMITGVDHLTTGEVVVHTLNGAVSIHKLGENDLALWRGRNMGVVYQSFQLLPMLSLLENVMLPMDLCGLYRRSESRNAPWNYCGWSNWSSMPINFRSSFPAASSSVWRSRGRWPTPAHHRGG